MEYVEHHFPPDLAVRCNSVDAAVFLRDIYHWVKKNSANGKHLHDGRYWTYNSMEAYTKIHPYWTRRKVERIINRCKEEGLLLTGCYNEDKRDRTMWYTLTDEGLKYFCSDVSAHCIAPNGEARTTEVGNTSHEMGQALPDNIPDNTQQITPIVPQPGDAPVEESKPKKSEPKYKPDTFDWFWQRYPKKSSKQAAIRAWDKLKPDKELCYIMLAALDRDRQSPQWTKDGGNFIPHFSTWLNQRRWEDEGVDLSLLPQTRDTGGFWADAPGVN